MTLKYSISALCPLACCLRRFEAKHKSLPVRQSLLIISAKRWHSQTAEGHTGLQALGWPHQEVLAETPMWLWVPAAQAGGRGWWGRYGFAPHCPEAQQLCLNQHHWHCASIASTGKDTDLREGLCEGPGALGKWGEFCPHFTIAETPSYAAVQESLVKPHPYWNGTGSGFGCVSS